MSRGMRAWSMELFSARVGCSFTPFCTAARTRKGRCHAESVRCVRKGARAQACTLTIIGGDSRSMYATPNAAFTARPPLLPPSTLCPLLTGHRREIAAVSGSGLGTSMPRPRGPSARVKHHNKPVKTKVDAGPKAEGRRKYQSAVRSVPHELCGSRTVAARFPRARTPASPLERAQRRSPCRCRLAPALLDTGFGRAGAKAIATRIAPAPTLAVNRVERTAGGTPSDQRAFSLCALAHLARRRPPR